MSDQLKMVLKAIKGVREEAINATTKVELDDAFERLIGLYTVIGSNADTFIEELDNDKKAA